MFKPITYFLFFLCFNLFAQSNTIQDSLYNILKAELNDTVRANTHYELGWYLKLQDLPSAKSHMDTAMRVYEQLKLPRKIALSHFQYSVLHRLAGDYNEAIKDLTAYQNYVEKVKDTANWIFSYYEKGVIYSQQGDLQASLEQFYAANNLSEAVGNDDMVATSFNSIGLVYNDLGRYQDAEINFKKALAVNKNLGVESEHLGDVLNGLASSFKNQKKYNEAIEYFDKAIAVYKKNESEFGIAIASFNKALTYVEQKRYKEALPLLRLAYKKQKVNGFNTELLLTISTLAKVNFELGNYKKSESLLDEGLNLEIESKLAAKDLFFELYKVYDKKGDYKKALDFHETYVKYKDSIYSEDNIKSINLLQKQFETEKKDKEIIEQKLMLQQQESELLNKKSENKFLWALAGIFLLGAMSTWFIFQQRQKRKNQEILTLKKEQQIKSLEALIRGEEKERSRIAKDLHDGVNGDLSAIKHRLSKYQNQTGIDLSEAIGMVDESCDEVRAISHNLLPPALEKYSLRESLSDYCMNLNEVRKEQVSFQYVGNNFRFSKSAEVTLFRIVQELVTNSLKHADSSDVLVQLTSFEDTIQLTVEDDGKGFNKDKIETLGLGLANVKSRVEYLSGELDMQSDKDGTHFNITFNKQNLNEG